MMALVLCGAGSKGERISSGDVTEEARRWLIECRLRFR